MIFTTEKELTDRIKELESQKKYAPAARLAEEYGLLETAQSDYLKAGWFSFAARIACERGRQDESTDLYKKAICSLLDKGAVPLAKEASQDSGLHDFFLDQLIERHLYLSAADYCNEIRDSDRREKFLGLAAELYTSEGDTFRAAEILEVLGQTGKAIAAYREVKGYLRIHSLLRLLSLESESTEQLLQELFEFPFKSSDIMPVNKAVKEVVWKLYKDPSFRRFKGKYIYNMATYYASTGKHYAIDWMIEQLKLIPETHLELLDIQKIRNR